MMIITYMLTINRWNVQSREAGKFGWVTGQTTSAVANMNSGDTDGKWWQMMANNGKRWQTTANDGKPRQTMANDGKW